MKRRNQEAPSERGAGKPKKVAQSAPEPAAGAPATAAAPPKEALAATRQWAKELIALGGPNTLLWAPESDIGYLDLTSAHPGGMAMLLAGRSTALGDLIRDPEKLDTARRRARRIAAHARELSEEHGLETAFLAYGIASWNPGEGQPKPYAPVLLRRCSLRSSGTGEDILDLSPASEVNPALLAFISRELGVKVDGKALIAQATTHDGVRADTIWTALSNICASLPGFTLHERLIYSTYPHHKAAGIADVVNLAGTIAAHPILAPLVGAGSPANEPAETSAPLVGSAADEEVFFLDRATQGVIDSLASGESVAVTAPPGTDPELLVAAAITQAAAARKSVLLVSEKRATIEGVHARLSERGLGDALLHVTDPASPAQPQVLLQRWADVADQPPRDPQAQAEAEAAALALDAHALAMHERREPWGVTLHQAQEAIVTLASSDHPPHSHARLAVNDLHGVSQERLPEHIAIGRTLASSGAWKGGSAGNPWWRARLEDDVDLRTALVVADRVRETGLPTLDEVWDEVLNETPLAPDAALAERGHLLATLRGTRETLEIFTPAIFDSNLDDLVDATSGRDEELPEIDSVRQPDEEYEVGRVEAWRLRRKARQMLRTGAPPEDLHTALVNARDQRQAWRDLTGSTGRPQVPVDLDRAAAAFSAVHGDLAWLSYVLEPTEAAADLTSLNRAALIERLTHLSEAGERAHAVPAAIGNLAILDAAGWSGAIEEFARRDLDADAVADEMSFIWWASIIEHLAASDPRYGQHDGDALRGHAATLDRVDTELVRGNAARLAVTAHNRFVTAVTGSAAASVAAIQGGGFAGMTWGQVCSEHLGLVRVAATALAMSPLHVGQLIARHERFDLVIVDDAAHTSTARVASALARGQQLLLIGDEHLLTPAPFTVTLGAGAGDPGPTPTPALVELAASLPHHTLTSTRTAPSRLLTEVVATRHQLVLDAVPQAHRGAGRSSSADTLEVVEGNGVLDESTGMVETTSAEVNRVIELIREHASTRPGESLGVITFGEPHSRRVIAALSDALAADTQFRQALADLPDTVVIKPAHRFAREERDRAIVTLGYGKTFQGRVIYRFGRLSEPEGAALLALAATRASRGTTWVTTLAPEDLDESKLNGPGPKALKETLERVSQLSEPSPDEAPGAELDSPDALVRHLAQRLRVAGHTVHEHLGVGSTVVDLGIEDPRDAQRMLLAVTLDGPGYLDLGRARARDVTRSQQLRAAGWHHLPLWSVDVFRDPAREESRINHEVLRLLDEEDRA